MTKLLHDDPEFDSLLRIVASERGLAPALVEKDYWVTHTLWSLHRTNLDIWFKGGTSLSKAFSLINRFSEDLDLKIEPGRVARLPVVTEWKRDGAKARSSRREFFRSLGAEIKVAGATVALDPDVIDETWRNANFRVSYRGFHLPRLPELMKPFVALEIGNARVSPFVLRPISSFVHDAIERSGLSDFEDNRPKTVRVVHPLVTLLEKLDAIRRRTKSGRPPATYVRHFEDAARIILARETLPELDGYPDVFALAEEMIGSKDLDGPLKADDGAFAPTGALRRELLVVHDAQSPMFWGARLGLEESCDAIRSWLEHALVSPSP